MALTKHVSKETLLEAGFGGNPQSIKMQFPPYGMSDVYIGRKQGANIVVVEAVLRGITNWYVDAIPGKRYDDMSEREKHRFGDTVRLMEDIRQYTKTPTNDLEQKIKEIAAHF